MIGSLPDGRSWPANWMNRRYRLTNSTDFKRVRRTGKTYAHPLAILIASPNDRTVSRFGVSAGRALGNAVRRNRAKRRLREALRRYMPRMVSGRDIVLIARPALNEAEWSDVLNAVATLLKRAGLLEEES
ncbi:MAG TPA: ribonuclease P protein component [Anaerolineae bacterium]|nr:ribonuclease P protein component [Anaerolineae bacterium]